jgi:hypothetical protein
MLNGRTVGDAFGKYTCHKTNGSSLNDYCIASEDILQNVLYFHVKQYMGHLSDHCGITFALKCRYQEATQDDKTKYKSQKFPGQFKWDLPNIFRFQQALNDKELRLKINELEHSNSLNNRKEIDDAVLKLNEIYITAASKSLKTKTMQGKGKNTNRKANDKKWYDKNLSQMKNDMIKNAKHLQKYPNIPSVRKVFFASLKLYNKSRKKKSREYKANLIQQLDELRTSNPQNYWKLLDSLKGSARKDNPAENISVAEWELYFKNLNTNKTPESSQDLMSI